jgi:hypothetical protein
MAVLKIYDAQDPFLKMFLFNILSVYSQPLFCSFSIWKVLENKKSFKKIVQETHLPLPTDKKNEHFQPLPKEKKVMPDSLRTANLCVGLHFFLREWQ